MTIETLGPLEIAILEVILKCGESATCHVLSDLPKVLAYTTVMTTLDRLYKKRLLNRRMISRAYYYSVPSGLNVEALSLAGDGESWIARTYTGEFKLVTNSKADVRKAAT